MKSCLRVTLDVIKYQGQKEVKEKEVYLAYASTSLFVTGGSQERN